MIMEVEGERLWCRIWDSTAYLQVLLERTLALLGSLRTHIVARESLTLEQDFMTAFRNWAVESSHEEVQVCRQRLHDGNFSWLSPNNWCNHL